MTMHLNWTNIEVSDHAHMTSQKVDIAILH